MANDPNDKTPPLILGADSASKPSEEANSEEIPEGPREFPPYQDPQGRKILPRHKRMALRHARQLGIKVNDANEALHLVTENGVNLFSNDESILDIAKPSAALAAAGAAASAGGQAGAGAPNNTRKKNQKKNQNRKKVNQAADSNLPIMQDPDEHNALTHMDQNAKAPSSREEEIAKIQRDLVRRRRRRLVAMLLRVVVLVFLPTFAIGYYYLNIATEMYETNSSFVIQTSDPSSGGFDSILAGTGFATSQDSIVVQDYLESREAFLLLMRDHGYVEHFRNAKIDQIQRLTDDATLDDAYELYQKNVIIGYDPTEGVVRMTVVATTPEVSQQFSKALISYAEVRVDGLTQQARGDQLEDANVRYRQAENDMLGAQQQVLELQQKQGVLSPEAELQSRLAIINSLALQSETSRLALAELQDNARPNQAQVDTLSKEIDRLDKRVSELRLSLTQSSEEFVSLAKIGAELRIAESALATRQLILQESIAALSAAQLEVNRQVRYLSIAVAPVAPVNATYPKKTEGTVLAFLIFAAIYILLSLTVSILREQVSV